MYSKLKSKIFIPGPEEDIFCESLPFTQKGNLLSLTEFYELKLLKIDLYYEEEKDWEGIFFYKNIEGFNYIFSGGRFGYAGFFSSNPKKQIVDYLSSIERNLINLNVATCSLTTSYLADPYSNKSSWNSTPISYLVANSKHSVNNEGLSFRKAIIRSNLSRNLKKAYKNELYCQEFFDSDILSQWHEKCHVPRISELNGNLWDLELLESLMKNGTGSILSVFNSSRQMIGGCFILKSSTTLEIFMMSTTRENQKLGVNHLIAEKIYLLANENSIEYINWQASNPPDSPLVRFKKEWNTEEKSFQILSKNWKKDLDVRFIEDNFRDCFIFPFNKI